jgi:UDP-N-acetylglucosamine 2-epimerase
VTSLEKFTGSPYFLANEYSKPMGSSKIKVTTIVGTRPEIIRLASIIKKLDHSVEHRLIHTGQNSDPNLSDVFFKDLDLRRPDKYLDLDGSSLGSFIGTLMIEGEKELTSHKPDAVLILGDTNSSLIALIAKRMQIPIYHLEAGNRSFDLNVPEEINRRVIDHISDFNLAYTHHAQRNLLREGLHPRTCIVIGSPLTEVLRSVEPLVSTSNILPEMQLTSGRFFLVSAHRQENVDLPSRLETLVDSLNQIAEKYQCRVLVSTHPRTRAKISKLTTKIHNLVEFHDPFGLIDYIALQQSARVVLSDSGSISEESAILKFTAITIRDSMERPEALEAGSILMTGLNANHILQTIDLVEQNPASETIPDEYKIPDTSTRVVNFMLSTIHQHHFWSGLRPLSQ